jgi:hypothetical protein
MEYVAIISNALLAILTGLYVVFTYRLVNETKRANEQSRMLFEKQFLLSTLPHLHINAQNEESDAYLTIFNSGDISAFDVDVQVVGLYHVDDIDVPTFMVRFVRPEHRREILRSDEGGFYSVFDHLYYPVFPQKRKVKAKLNLPIPPYAIYCLLQYREVSGANYSQLYHFFQSRQEDQKTYRLSSIDPQVIKSGPRIDYDSDDEQGLKAEGNQLLPEYISEEFLALRKNALSSGFTGYELPDVEDRGEWHDI